MSRAENVADEDQCINLESRGLFTIEEEEKSEALIPGTQKHDDSVNSSCSELQCLD